MKWDKIELQMIALEKKKYPDKSCEKDLRKECSVMDEKIYNTLLHDLIHVVNPIKEEKGYCRVLLY